MQYRDLVVHTTAETARHQHQMTDFPPIQSRIPLSDQIWLGPVEKSFAESVIDVCERKGLVVFVPVRQFGQLYSFVRELPSSADIYNWDDDHELIAAVALSRLIHPTFVGFAYAARLGHDEDGVKQVFPPKITGISREAFLSQNHKRDWLTESEAYLLRDLILASKEEVPRRIQNALWHHEYACRTYYIDHRWTLVCTGLEALVHTERKRNTAQFTLRVPQLASLLGIPMTEADASEAYDLRSRLSHGVSVLSQGSKQLELYDRLEEVLRRAVLRSMQDKSFGHIFRDDEKIRETWPI